MQEPSFSIGIEEEYLLVDRKTRDLVTTQPANMLEECAERCSDQLVSPELLRAQIEVGTRVCRNMAEARASLSELRTAVADVADSHGLAPIAASSHPFAHWEQQKHTAAARRLLICGMHVHVGIDDDELRIDLMNQFSYFLPHLLALSCSSPFWEARDTGLKSYRLTVFDAVPRTGLPERFDSYAEYERHIRVLVDAGLIPDSTMIWWDLRPSARYPTLETRIMDVCTSMDDALCLAALTACTLRMLYRLRTNNQRWRMYSRLMLAENRWRAMRYSFDEGLIDLGRGRIIPFAQLVEEILELTREDAEALDCVSEVEHVHSILAHGTSAHRQVRAHKAALEGGADPEEAVQAVVDHLIKETVRGVQSDGKRPSFSPNR